LALRAGEVPSGDRRPAGRAMLDDVDVLDLEHPALARRGALLILAGPRVVRLLELLDGRLRDARRVHQLAHVRARIAPVALAALAVVDLQRRLAAPRRLELHRDAQ